MRKIKFINWINTNIKSIFIKNNDDLKKLADSDNAQDNTNVKNTTGDINGQNNKHLTELPNSINVQDNNNLKESTDSTNNNLKVKNKRKEKFLNLLRIINPNLLIRLVLLIIELLKRLLKPKRKGNSKEKVKIKNEVEEGVEIKLQINMEKLSSGVLTEFYFIIASDKFLVMDEPVEEILRERTQHYRRLKKITDFWFLKSPKFIDSLQFKNLKATLPETYSAIVSTDKIFITWLNLRLNNVATGSFFAPTKDIPSPLESNLK